MRYFVISPDGQKYGPADVPTLNQWIIEARLNSTSMLEDEAGSRLVASAVSGLNFPMQPPPTAAHSNYPRVGPQGAAPIYQQVDTGGSEATRSIVLGGVSIVLGFIFAYAGLATGIYGVIAGVGGLTKGSKKAYIGLALSIIGIVMWVAKRFM